MVTRDPGKGWSEAYWLQRQTRPTLQDRRVIVKVIKVEKTGVAPLLPSSMLFR